MAYLDLHIRKFIWHWNDIPEQWDFLEPDIYLHEGEHHTDLEIWLHYVVAFLVSTNQPMSPGWLQMILRQRGTMATATTMLIDCDNNVAKP